VNCETDFVRERRGIPTLRRRRRAGRAQPRRRLARGIAGSAPSERRNRGRGTSRPRCTHRREHRECGGSPGSRAPVTSFATCIRP
jgi:hypothetical protein